MEANAQTQPSKTDLRVGLAACVAAAACVASLGLFRVANLDIGYHLAYGRHFLDHREIVSVDPFLDPATAKPFVNANWGGQVIFAIVERIGGPNGLILLRLLLIGIVFGCIARLMSRLKAGPHWIAWAWLIAALAAYERFDRIELFSYALMAMVLVAVSAELWTLRRVALIGLLQILWVNLHSYFLMGLVITSCRLAAEALAFLWMHIRRGTPRDPNSASDALRRIRLIAIALAIQFAACCVNPWFIDGALFPIQTLRYLESTQSMGGGPGDAASSPWSNITEFQSPFRHWNQPIAGRTIEAYALLLGLSLIGLIAALALGRNNHAMLILLLFLTSVKMRRNIAQFAFVAAPLSLAAVSGMMQTLPNAAIVRRIAGWISACSLTAVSIWCCAGVYTGRFYYTENRIVREFGLGYLDRVVPKAAAEWLGRYDALQPNILVNYAASSNVLPWLPARFKLLLNTNTFAYDDSVMTQVNAVCAGEIDSEKFLDEHHINVVLLGAAQEGKPLISRLTKDFGWALVYVDPHFVIFIRRMHQHVPITAENHVADKPLDVQAWIDAVKGPACYRALELNSAAAVPIALGWPRPAVTLLEEAVRAAPDYEEAWYNLGICHGNLGQAASGNRQYESAKREYEAAQDCFQRVIHMGGRNATNAKIYFERTQPVIEEIIKRLRGTTP